MSLAVDVTNYLMLELGQPLHSAEVEIDATSADAEIAARLKRAKSALIMHDLYPDVLIMAELLKPTSIVAHAMRLANALMFRLLNA